LLVTGGVAAVVGEDRCGVDPALKIGVRSVGGVIGRSGDFGDGDLVDLDDLGTFGRLYVAGMIGLKILDSCMTSHESFV
jgi:hypothetical protein